MSLPSTVSGIDNDKHQQQEEEEEYDRNDDNLNYCNGTLRPRITFMGETLSNQVNRRIESDQNKVDALIVIGTSLSVAPISKVIEYLPTNIPRILINKTIVVQPKKLNKKKSNNKNNDDDNDNDDENENENDIDFRKDYVFDSYLLGYCDDVTRALGKHLGLGFDTNKNNKNNNVKNNQSNSTPNINHSNTYASDASARLLTTVLREEEKKSEDDDDYDGSNINIGTIPPERIILFPGADIDIDIDIIASSTANNKNKTNNRADEYNKEEETTIYEEIAHCDGCSQIINTFNGNKIYKCSICFDYDLCSICYPKQSKKHCNGKHKFHTE